MIVVALIEKLIDMVGNLRHIDPAEMLVDGVIMTVGIAVLVILIGNT